jgi:predicted PurR-regulated permease PerM
VAATPSESPNDRAQWRSGAARARYAPVEARALGTMAILAALAILCILVPVGIGVLLGTLLAFTLYHPYRSLLRRTLRPTLSAAAMTTIATLAVAGTLGALLYLLVLQGVSVLGALPQSLAPGGDPARLVRRLAAPLSVVGLSPAAIEARLRDALGGIATSLAGWAAQVAGFVFDGALALFFTAITMFFVLRHWPELARRAEYLMPINPHHTRRLMRELHRLGRQTVIGNFGTGIIQGAIAGVGYAIAHIPNPGFLGAITAIASLLPAFGTLLVWVPAALVLLVEGRVGAGGFELVWGALLVVGFCDYVVRPRLLGRGETMSMWVTFVALFGGIKLFGFVGFLLGPLIVGISLATLRLYERTRKFRLGLR